MKKRNLLLGMASLAFANSSSAQATVPFSTSIRNYAYVGKPGFNNAATTVSLFISTNPAASNGGFSGSGTPITISNASVPQNLNAAGINGADGYLYGLEYLYVGPQSAGANIYRVGANGAGEKLAEVLPPNGVDAGSALQYTFINTASGFVDGNDCYWFSAYGLTDLSFPLTTKLRAFIGAIPNISTRTPGATIDPMYYLLDVSNPTLQNGFVNYMTIAMQLVLMGQSPTNTNGGWQDMDVRPGTTDIYSYVGLPSSGFMIGGVQPALHSYLVKINQSFDPWKVELVNTTGNTTPSVEQSGMYFADNSTLYAEFTNGAYATIDPNTGAISVLGTAGLPLQNNNSRGDLATNSPAIPLPVTLQRFTASAGKQSNLLEWTVSARENTASTYQPERSNNNKDFVQMATISANSNGSYTFEDKMPAMESFYRIRITEANGSVTYSPVARISRSAATDISFAVFPTVMTDNQLSISYAGGVRLEVFDASGRMVYTTALSGEGATNTMITLPEMAPGVYNVIARNAATGQLSGYQKVVRN